MFLLILLVMSLLLLPCLLLFFLPPAPTPSQRHRLTRPPVLPPPTPKPVPCVRARASTSSTPACSLRLRHVLRCKRAQSARLLFVTDSDLDVTPYVSGCHIIRVRISHHTCPDHLNHLCTKLLCTMLRDCVYLNGIPYLAS